MQAVSAKGGDSYPPDFDYSIDEKHQRRLAHKYSKFPILYCFCSMTGWTTNQVFPLCFFLGVFLYG
jgi:hypothetical protein